MDFGGKIRKLRLERGMTLEAVAKIVGVGKSTVRKWETGEIKNMRRDKIALLANALSIAPESLMGWKEDKDEPSPARPDLRKAWVMLSEGERVLTDEQLNLLYNVAHQMRPDVYPPLDELKG